MDVCYLEYNEYAIPNISPAEGDKIWLKINYFAFLRCFTW